MRHTRLITSLALTAALALAAAPALAQQRDGGNRRGSQQGGGQRQSAPRQGAQPLGGQRPQAAPRADTRRAEAPRSVPSRPYTVLRDSGQYRGSVTIRGGVRSVPRVLDRHAFIVGGPRFYSPYYTFRPRLSLGFGLWVGYPVSYPSYDIPYVYGVPYSYQSPYASDPYYSSNYYGSTAPYSNAPDYQYPPNGDVSIAGGEQPGGLSFTISPIDAAVFVDGVYVGTAAEFGATSQPLGLVPGRHRIEVRANGYRTLAFDADVVAGQVVPYRATLQR